MHFIRNRKTFVRRICVCLALLLTLTMPVAACNVVNDAAESMIAIDSVIHIKDLSSSKQLSFPYKVMQGNLITEESQPLNYDHVLVDVSCLQEDLNQVLRTVYQAGSDILFVGDISISDVREALGIPVPEYSKEDIYEMNSVAATAESENVDDMVIDTSFFPSVGKKVSTDGRKTVITDITVETAIPSEITGAINAALAYDYLSLTSGTNVTAQSSSDWEIVDTIAREQYMTKCVVQTCTEFWKDQNNPSDNGKYYFYAWHSSDVERRSNYFIWSIESEVSGKSTSRIEEFEPRDTEALHTSLSGTFPWGIGWNFDIGTTTKITKASNSGVGHSSLKICFLPADKYGYASPATKLGTRVDAKFYQPDGYFNVIGCSYISVCDTVTGYNLTTYRTNSDILTGS